MLRSDNFPLALKEFFKKLPLSPVEGEAHTDHGGETYGFGNV
jgi:hypothetical protein